MGPGDGTLLRTGNGGRDWRVVPTADSFESFFVVPGGEIGVLMEDGLYRLRTVR